MNATNADILAIDPSAMAEHIQRIIREQVLSHLRRRGIVVGLSGGVDSSVVAALASRALGRDRVLALLMPERDASSDALKLGLMVAKALGIPFVIEDVTPLLDAAGCYQRQIDAIRKVFPDYGKGFRCKVVLPSILESGRISVSRLIIETPSGQQASKRMDADSYRELIAATSFKQRMRKTMEYYHADRLGYAVAGTPNRLEYDQGFFVKQGDGAADLKPIAHLFKTQVYALAAHLGIPEEIRRRPPTTDTYSLEQTQEEFFFSVPYQKMDVFLWAFERGVSTVEAARRTGLTPEQAERVYTDIIAKRRAARYLHTPPLMVEEI